MKGLPISHYPTLVEILAVDDKSEYFGGHDQKYTEGQTNQDAKEDPERPERLLPSELYETIHLHENISELQSQKDSQH